MADPLWLVVAAAIALVPLMGALVVLIKCRDHSRRRRIEEDPLAFDYNQNPLWWVLLLGGGAALSAVLSSDWLWCVWTGLTLVTAWPFYRRASLSVDGVHVVSYFPTRLERRLPWNQIEDAWSVGHDICISLRWGETMSLTPFGVNADLTHGIHCYLAATAES
jgi:hypothetical protein